MTMLSMIRPVPPVTTASRSRLHAFLLARFKRLVDRMVAAVIARHQRQVELFVLRRLSDRELREIGIYRDQIGPGLEDTAGTRTQLVRLQRAPACAAVCETRNGRKS